MFCPLLKRMYSAYPRTILILSYIWLMILLNLHKRIRTTRVFNTTKVTIVSIMKGCSYQTCSQSTDHCNSSNKNLFKQGNTERINNIWNKYRIKCNLKHEIFRNMFKGTSFQNMEMIITQKFQNFFPSGKNDIKLGRNFFLVKIKSNLEYDVANKHD